MESMGPVEVQAELLYRRPGVDDDRHLQLVVPAPQREDLMKLYHDIPSAGHLGYNIVIDKVHVYQDFC